MSGRTSAADQLDYVTTEIVHCDDEFCPDLKDMMMDALLIAAEIKEPKLEAELRQCQTSYSQSDPRCDRLFMQRMFDLLSPPPHCFGLIFTSILIILLFHLTCTIFFILTVLFQLVSCFSYLQSQSLGL